MRYRWLANLLVLTLLIYFGVSTVLSVWKARLEPPPVIDPAPVRTSAKQPSEVRPLEQYAIIAERNLFGGSVEEESPGKEEVSLEGLPLAVKSLGLRLVGTVVTKRPEQNIAFIETRGARKQETYHEGDRVETVLVKRILRHNVVINNGERDEVLTMEPDENAASYQPPPKTSPAPRQPVRSKPRAASRTIRLKREEIEPSLANLNELMQQVQIRPYMEGEEAAGFLLSGIKPGSLFDKMGLRNGDVVKGVNDEVITTPDQAIELYESLVEGQELGLEIKRGRSSQNLRYEVQ